MQFDTLRAFPYPVLRPDVDDYTDGDIQVTVDFSATDDGKEVAAAVDLLVSVNAIKKEIAAGRARYIAVFACRDTYYRRVVSTDKANFEVKFPAGSLRGEVQIFPYVSAIKTINGYRSRWINPEFGSGPFRYDVGAVLAIDRPQTVYIDRDLFKSLQSVFVLVKDDAIAGHEWQIRPTDDKVQICVSPELKERIDVARNNKSNRAVLVNSIYFSAVMQCISIIRREGDEETDTRWGRVIRQKCHNEGINIKEHDEYLIAERLLKSPFQLIDAYVFQKADS